MLHRSYGIAPNVRNAQQGALRVQEVALLYRLALANEVKQGVNSNNGLKAVVPEDRDGCRRSVDNGCTSRTYDMPTTRACSGVGRVRQACLLP